MSKPHSMTDALYAQKA